MSSRWSAAIGIAALALAGCARAPSPLAPQFTGSIGTPNRGVLTAAAELPREGEGFRWLRDDDRHFGIPRFVSTLERVAAKVARERPGAPLMVGDLSKEHGGRLLPHFSHRSGRDADLLFYVTTLDGAPVACPEFIRFGPDGLAWDDEGKRFLRFDVERTWLLVKELVEDPDARIQWIFAHRNIEALLIEWARARGEPSETIVRAMEVLHEPRPGGPHDDHVHIRTACSPEELARGCEHTGPRRAWFDADETRPAAHPPEWELVEALLRPLESTADAEIAAATRR